MKNKPEFKNLPWALEKRLLWEMDLDYDGYESSKAEVIHDISNGLITQRNQDIIDTSYKQVPLETLELYLKQEIEQKEISLKRLKEMLDS